MTKTIKIILIVAGVILVGILGFYFMSKDKNVDSSLVVQSTPMSPKVDSSDATAFLSTLLSLNKIKIDIALFNNPIFTRLKDNTVPILNEGGVGRSNPFAEITSNNMPVDNGMSLPQINNDVTAKNVTPSN